MAIQFKYALPTSRAAIAELTVIAFSDKLVLDTPLNGFDELVGGAIKRSVDSRQFRGARDEQLHVTGAQGTRILLIGIGSPTDKAGALRRAASIAARQAAKLGATSAVFYGGDTDAREIESIVVGFIAG
jgi:hypothetical protein